MIALWYAVYLDNGRLYDAALTWPQACALSRRLNREGRPNKIGTWSA